MKPRKPLKRKSWLRSSRRPIAPRRADPTKRAWATHRCEPFRLWIKRQACVVSHAFTGWWAIYFVGNTQMGVEVYVDPAHTRPRSRGADDLYEVIPLARHLHEEQERIGWPAFERKYSINRKALAAKYAEEWLRTADGLAWRDAHPTNEDV